jgi:hypothetical protein
VQATAGQTLRVWELLQPSPLLLPLLLLPRWARQLLQLRHQALLRQHPLLLLLLLPLRLPLLPLPLCAASVPA